MEENKVCPMCGDEFSGYGEYCQSCATYLHQAYQEMEREARGHEEYRQEMRRDAFGE